MATTNAIATLEKFGLAIGILGLSETFSMVFTVEVEGFAELKVVASTVRKQKLALFRWKVHYTDHTNLPDESGGIRPGISKFNCKETADVALFEPLRTFAF